MAKRAARLMLLFTLLLPGAYPALAQSTIFNVPTTDTVPKGRVLFEFDWLAQNPNSRGLNRLHLFTPKVMVGVARNIEVSAQVPVHHRESTTDAFLESGVKWKFAASEKKGLAAAVGSLLITPVNNQVFADTYTLVYANISKQLKAGKYGPRLTAGPYGVLFSDFWLGPKAGAMIGYEQPIPAKARIVADWYSGQNGLGYLTPGISFTLPANSVLNAGYSFGNDSYGNFRDNRLLFLRYGITF